MNVQQHHLGRQVRLDWATNIDSIVCELRQENQDYEIKREREMSAGCI